jgi:DNA-binding winged helix-turn-helix (wHTH) protein/Tfp pilus assembly protein PilF
MSGGGPGQYEFGPFRLNARRRVLLRDGHQVPLTPKAFDILTLLVSHHGRVVEKGEILDAVWPGTAVEEGNLTVNMSLIRRVLGESRTEHPFIVTIPGRGYQFVGDVQSVEEVQGLEENAPRPAADAPHSRWTAALLMRRFALGSALLLSLALPMAFIDHRPPYSGTPTEDPEARALYLRGRFLLDRRTEDALAKGQGYFERAMARAPEYASAYAGLADALSVQSYFGMLPPGEAHPRAKTAALRALDLDPDSAEAHTSLAYIFHRFEWNWKAAEQNFRRAIALDPEYALAHHWYGAFLDSVGRREEAIAEARRAEMLDPLTPLISANLNAMLQPNSAVDFFERGHRLIEMDPGFWLAHWSIGSIYRSRGQQAMAIEEYERAAELAGRGTYVLTRLGVAYANAARPADARAVIEELDLLGNRRYVSPFARVPILAALGDHDEAFVWLARAFDERSAQLALIRVSLSELQADPRFNGFLARVGLQ